MSVYSERKPIIGMIGGSGLYDMDGLTDKQWHTITTSWGNPSDQLLSGWLGDVKCVFLPRHGRGHSIAPSHLNYRANIDAFKRMGVTDIISLSAVGSLKEELAPGQLLLIDQFIDRSVSRERSFFDMSCVAHVSLARPVCPRIGDILEDAAEASCVNVVRGGTYLVLEGPQFSTRAESEMYRNWGCSVVGMTNMPEAALAREAEICYATVAMVTDYDCWHDEHDDVSVDAVIHVLLDNVDRARKLVRHSVPLLGKTRRTCPYGCDTALDHAVITPASNRAPDALAKLDIVAGRVLRKE